ncbi:hypothetical protein ASE25_21855 [Terrabacter sp. Root85]|uniref:hypothetical protein n=1 Tax=Terrabacter sp. Root85 TaxID=1736603 RepID=UPI000712AE99|nr:hypothetical protein [Terrabacter sp. Root85]KRC91073.1 hypothetical protein ASE25_21855 [Terrabacter sp. Root85]
MTVDLSAQREQWMAATGETLLDRWHAVEHLDGRTRFMRESEQFGASSWDRPVEPIVATFQMRPESAPISRWLHAQLPALDAEARHAETSKYSQVVTVAQDAARASRLDFNTDTLVSLSQARMPAAWGISWPAGGSAPVEFLRLWAEDQRTGLAIDGSLMAAVAFVIDAVSHAGNDRAAIGLAAPLRDGAAPELIRRIVRKALEHDHLDMVFELFDAYYDHATSNVPLDAASVDEFHTQIYDLMPTLIMAVEIGWMLTEPETPLAPDDVELLGKRTRRMEEVRVRLLESTDNRVHNLIGSNAARQRHVRQIRASGAVSQEAVGRAVDRLIEQRLFYPRSAREGLIAEAQG